MNTPHSTPLPAAFPFVALQGQELLKTALLLSAVDPLIGGVLIEGPRGIAKSTAARALAELLPGGQFVNLPLSASEEQLVGTLDLEAALQDGTVRFRPGLLARAHEGVLYVDEINLLPDGLVDLLLDVCASGINHVERDGISHTHPARIALIGTMNPEEGGLRPQLLDRFGLCVRLDDALSPAERQAIVRTRLAFDADPAVFRRRVDAAQRELSERLVRARRAIDGIGFDDATHERVATLCHATRVEGVRADLVMLRAARAHAALNARETIDASDVAAVAELVLSHRRPPGDAPAEPRSTGADAPLSSGTTPSPGTQQSSDTTLPSGTTQSSDKTSDDDWGALPEAPPAPVPLLKSVRPLTSKKA